MRLRFVSIRVGITLNDLIDQKICFLKIANHLVRLEKDEIDRYRLFPQFV